MGRCCVKGCKLEGMVIYYNYEICSKHWAEHCDGKLDLSDLKK